MENCVQYSILKQWQQFTLFMEHYLLAYKYNAFTMHWPTAVAF